MINRSDLLALKNSGQMISRTEERWTKKLYIEVAASPKNLLSLHGCHYSDLMNIQPIGKLI